MRVLITCGSKRGGTEGIGRMLADTLQQEGHRVELLSPDEAARATGFDAAIVGERCTRTAGIRPLGDSCRVAKRRYGGFPSGSSRAVHSTMPPPVRSFRRAGTVIARSARVGRNSGRLAGGRHE